MQETLIEAHQGHPRALGKPRAGLPPNLCHHRPAARRAPRRGYDEPRHRSGRRRGQRLSPRHNCVPTRRYSARPACHVRHGSPDTRAVDAHGHKQRDDCESAQAPTFSDRTRQTISAISPTLSIKPHGTPSLAPRVAGGIISPRQHIDASPPKRPYNPGMQFWELDRLRVAARQPQVLRHKDDANRVVVLLLSRGL
jgi:hypothetical protein